MSSRTLGFGPLDIYDTCVLLNKKRTLGLDYEPNGYAFLNYGDKSPKWVFIKSKTFPQAYSIRPANNIELALTFDEKRNAATVKPAQVNSSANQFWTITDRDNLKSVIDNESELNLDILSQNAGAKAYLHKPSPGYMTPDEDSDNETLYGKSVSTVDFVGGKKYRYNSRGENVPVANPRHNSSSSVGLFNRQPIYTESEISSMYNKNKSKTYGNYGKNFSTSASRNREVKKETRNYYRSNSTPVPQRQRSQGVNHRGLRYDYDPAFSHVGSHSKDVSFRNRASLASITESEIGARTEYEDQQFNRMLERNFKQLKLQERLAKEKSKRMFRQQKILDAKLKDYENKKSKEAKLWLEAYNRITPDGVTGSRTGLKSLDQVVRNMSMIKVPRKEAEEEAATLVEENERVGIEKVLAEKEGETRNTNVDESATLLESKISFAGKTIPKPQTRHSQGSIAAELEEIEGVINQFRKNVRYGHQAGSTVIDTGSFYGKDMSRKQNHWDAVHGIEFKKNALQNTNLKADQIAAIESKIRDLESRLRTVKRSAK